MSLNRRTGFVLSPWPVVKKYTPMTMSCDGLTMGFPFAGLKMLCVDIISTCVSVCASTDSGRWTAIWSPSKSAL
jgi:hypothetical protein